MAENWSVNITIHSVMGITRMGFTILQYFLLSLLAENNPHKTFKWHFYTSLLLQVKQTEM